MQYLRKSLLCILLLFFTNNHCFASGRPTLRRILNSIHADIGVGHGASFYQNKVLRMQIVKRKGYFFLVNTGEEDSAYIIEWFNSATVKTTVKKKNFNINEVAGDTISNLRQKVVFKGIGRTTPSTLILYTEIKKRLRLGGGIGTSINTIDKLKPNAEQKQLGDYNTSQRTTYYKSYFGMLGFKVVDKPAYAIVADARIGEHFSYAKWRSKRFIEKSTFYNVGITAEKNISQYFRLFGRASYEYQSLAKKIFQKGLLLLGRSDIYCQFGISLNWPELPRCKIRNCKIEIKHHHRGKGYRGVSMLKGKDALGNLIHERQSW